MNFQNSRIEYINSANRTTGTNENFVYTMSLAPDEYYDHVCVLFANVPISYYVVRAGFNTFKLQELTTTVTITIPPGNYSAASFISVVVPLINAASPNTWIYNISINNNFTNVADGKFYYTVTGNGVNQPSIITTQNVYNQLGFNQNSTNTFVSNALVSTNVLNFIPESTMYLYSNLIETKHNNTTNVLQELYGENNTNFSNLVYQCTSVEGYSKRIKQPFSNSFSLQLLDEYENVMNLNGQPFFVTLLFYKSNDVFDIIKRFIKYNLLMQPN